VLLNGTAIHNNIELPRPTAGGIDAEVRARGPLLLQDHGDPVRYRNIWVRETSDEATKRRSDEGKGGTKP
jgi:hypothetical protein